MAFDNPAENLCLTCHDENNVNVRTTVSVVNRYHKVEKIFGSDAVDHFNHSFPEPSSKIKPSRYMELENKGSEVAAQASWSAPTLTLVSNNEECFLAGYASDSWFRGIMELVLLIRGGTKRGGICAHKFTTPVLVLIFMVQSLSVPPVGGPTLNSREFLTTKPTPWTVACYLRSWHLLWLCFFVCLMLDFTTCLSILSKLHALDEASKLWRGSTLLPGLRQAVTTQ